MYVSMYACMYVCMYTYTQNRRRDFYLTKTVSFSSTGSALNLSAFHRRRSTVDMHILAPLTNFRYVKQRRNGQTASTGAFCTYKRH